MQSGVVIGRLKPSTAVAARKQVTRIALRKAAHTVNFRRDENGKIEDAQKRQKLPDSRGGRRKYGEKEQEKKQAEADDSFGTASRK